MTSDNLKDFSIQWILAGLLFFALISFASLFVYNNNPIALGDNQEVYDDLETSLDSKLTLVEDDGNSFLNITSFTDPEASYLGSRDSTATSYGIMGTGKSFFEEMKLFIAFVFAGDIGKMLVSVLAGIFSFLALYFITKWFRTGT